MGKVIRIRNDYENLIRYGRPRIRFPRYDDICIRFQGGEMIRFPSGAMQKAIRFNGEIFLMISNFTPTGGQEQINVTFNTNISATGYFEYNNGSGWNQSGTGTGTSFNITESGLAADTYSVRAVAESNGLTIYSSEINVVVTAAYIEPNYHSFWVYSNPGYRSVDFYWETDNPQDEMQVKWKQSSDPTYTIENARATSGTTHRYDNVYIGDYSGPFPQTFYYKVRTKNNGQWGNWSGRKSFNAFNRQIFN